MLKRSGPLLLASLVFAVAVAVAVARVASAEPPSIGAKTTTDVRRAIQQYVDRDARLKGAFMVLDPRTDTPLALRFDHVHRKIESHPEGLAACVDFKDTGGKLYDVDVVVSPSPGHAVRRVVLHKVEGQAVAAPAKSGR